MARPPNKPRRQSGNLLCVKGRWYARITVSVGGKPKRITRALDTTHKPTAELRLARLLAAESPEAESPSRAETFAEAARRVVDKQTIRTKSERLSRLKKFAFGDLGTMPVTEVRRVHVRGVLDAAAAKGLARSTIKHLPSRSCNDHTPARDSRVCHRLHASVAERAQPAGARMGRAPAERDSTHTGSPPECERPP